jgi:hypothetical protein
MPGNDGSTTVAPSDRVADYTSPATYQSTAAAAQVQRIVYGDNSWTSYLGKITATSNWQTWTNSSTCVFDLDDWADWTTTSNAITAYKLIPQVYRPWKYSEIIWGDVQEAAQLQPQVADPGPPQDPEDPEISELLRRAHATPHGPQILVPTPRVNPPPVIQPLITDEADQRAMALLCRFLTPAQRKELEEHKHFHVRSFSGQLFRIEWGWARNIRLIDEKTNKPVRGFCIHPRSQVPVADNLLAQKLMLEGSEPEFLNTANAFAV